MSVLRLIISTIAVIIASCEASGIGHLLPAIRSVPIVRYAPFYNFPGGVRSIHAVAPAFPAVAPALPVAPAPVLPAQFAAPVLPAPAPVFPAPVQAFALAPAPVFPAPAYAPAPAPVFPAPAFASAFAPAPIAAPAFNPFLPRFAPAAPALHASPILARALPLPASVPFSPIVRAVAPAIPQLAPGPLFTPSVAPAPFAVAKAFPLSISPYANHLHAYNNYLAPAPVPHFKQVAWK